MHHKHLLRLVDYEFIDWNEEKNEISMGPQFKEIRPFLEFVADQTES